MARSAGIPHFAETRNYVKPNHPTLLRRIGSAATAFWRNPVHDPMRVERDARGVLYISNTD